MIKTHDADGFVFSAGCEVTPRCCSLGDLVNSSVDARLTRHSRAQPQEKKNTLGSVLEVVAWADPWIPGIAGFVGAGLEGRICSAHFEAL